MRLPRSNRPGREAAPLDRFKRGADRQDAVPSKEFPKFSRWSAISWSTSSTPRRTSRTAAA